MIDEQLFEEIWEEICNMTSHPALIRDESKEVIIMEDGFIMKCKAKDLR